MPKPFSPDLQGFLAGPRRFFSLPKAERRAWRRAWWQLLVADLRLRVQPARTLERALEVPALPVPGETIDADQLVRAVASAANHHLWPMRCLPRSLALQSLLASSGVAARLCIGVRRDTGSLSAHAWVEIAGRPIGELDAVEERFLPLVDRRGLP